MKITLTVTKKPKLKKPILICGWPGIGEVAYKIVSYLKDKLKMAEFASISAPRLFPPAGIWIENNLIGLPQIGSGKFYFYKNGANLPDLIIFVSDAQPLLEQSEDYCRKILSLAREMKVKKVFTFAAMPQAIDHLADPEVWFAATNKKIAEEFKSSSAGLKPLPEGQVSGLNGIFLGIAKLVGFEGACLLGEVPLFAMQMESPKSALAIINKLSKILSITVDTVDLAAQAKTIEQEIEKLIEFIHSGHQGPGPIGDEEIEKIKKSLSLYTKLPQSARGKIERLFQEAKLNIAKANELKKELDHWNVYKDFEDRFLDLFKKTKEEEKKHS